MSKKKHKIFSVKFSCGAHCQRYTRMPDFIKAILLLLLAVGLVGAAPYSQANSSAVTDGHNTSSGTSNKNLKKDDGKLSPVEHAEKSDFSGLIEVKEDEIPEGSLVYVLDEPLDQPSDGELLNTANNVVFRPLFRYRAKQKQEFQRRSSHRFRRRYFIPSRSYRQAYYPYYHSYRYY